jgi:hypothetical protein
LVYQQTSRTAILDVNPATYRDAGVPGTVLLPKRTLAGLADYDKSSGFKSGDVTLEWVSKTLAYDRGRSFSVDALDDMSALDMAFGGLFSQFFQEYASPEIDAIRFARYATGANADQVIEGTPTAANIVGLIDDAIAALNDANASAAGRYLFLTEPMYKYLKQGASTSRLYQGNVINRNVMMFDDVQIVRVPSANFYTKITTAAAGGFTPTVGGYPVNFLLLQKDAVLQLVKHEKMREFSPDVNQGADAYRLDYRISHDAWVMPNKEKGIFVNRSATAVAA